MEKYEELILESKKYLKRADHLAFVTYPLIKETKLLLNIVQNLNLSLLKALDSFLVYERTYKRTMQFPLIFKEKINLTQHLGRKYNIQKEELDLIKKIKEIVDYHKKSPIEFSRKEKFVIFSEQYSSYKLLKIEEVKNHIMKAKVFIHRVANIISYE